MSSASRAIGFDISKWQREWKESQSEVKHDFGWIKASDGESADPRFEQHYEQLLEVPRRGAFHYLRSDLPWESQLNCFLNLIHDKSFHMVKLDFEGIGNVLSWQFGRDAQRWTNHCESEFKGLTLLYTNVKYYHYLVNQGFRWMNNFDLVLARYPFDRCWDPSLEKIQEPDFWHPALPATRKEWTFWQFSADGNKQGPRHGVTRQPWHIYNLLYPDIDLQVFDGTPEDLDDYLEIGEGPPDPIDCSKAVKDGKIEILDSVIQELEVRKSDIQI